MLKEQYCIGTWNIRSMNQGKLEVVKQEMAKVNIDILGICKLKWTGMGEFHSDDHYICGQESLRRNGAATTVKEELMFLNCSVGEPLLRVPWTASRSNQSILKEISPGISLEGMMLKLKLQYFGHLMRRVDSLEKTLILGGLGAGGEGDDRGRDGWMASPTRWT